MVLLYSNVELWCYLAPSFGVDLDEGASIVVRGWGAESVHCDEFDFDIGMLSLEFVYSRSDYSKLDFGYRLSNRFVTFMVVHDIELRVILLRSYDCD